MAGEKGQFFYSWTETSDWQENQELNLRFKSIQFGSQGQESQAVLIEYAPGSAVPAHHHPSDYCSIVVKGSIEITRRRHGPGSIRVVKAGTVYGPLRVGEEGCTVIDVFAAGERGITYVGPKVSSTGQAVLP